MLGLRQCREVELCLGTRESLPTLIEAAAVIDPIALSKTRREFSGFSIQVRRVPSTSKWRMTAGVIATNEFVVVDPRVEDTAFEVMKTFAFLHVGATKGAGHFPGNFQGLFDRACIHSRADLAEHALISLRTAGDALCVHAVAFDLLEMSLHRLKGSRFLPGSLAFLALLGVACSIVCMNTSSGVSKGRAWSPHGRYDLGPFQMEGQAGRPAPRVT
jgi:hypothetical protein